MSALPDTDADSHLLGEDGQFHATDEDVQFADTPIEAWIALLFFWALALTVFYQFLTRYVLNDSAAWTEEIARYLLIATVFTGAAIGVAKNNHIQVDFFYRHLPKGVCRLLSSLTDILRCVFLGAATFLTWQMMERLGSYKMTIVDLPMNIVYGICMFGFASMFLRSLWVAKMHWQRGYSVLERPESSLHDAH